MIEQGFFLTFEGVHGAGKSTIIAKLKTKLLEKGHNVIYVPDQSGTPLGKELKRVNLSFNNVSPLTEALIVAAARHQSVVEVIKPNLLKGKIVIGERYIDSFFAYQHARHSTINALEAINEAVAEETIPNITFLIDIDPGIAIERIPVSERHRFEKENLDFHSRLREGYLLRAKREPKRIKIINGALPLEDVIANVWNIVNIVINK
ncbi:MAG: dTMP kinase [Anaerolineales bacterium]|nr:dTMP kinase [Anaerolineales bacterium]